MEKVNSRLIVPDAEGKPFSVRYEAVNAMLLNEFLKEHRKNEKQEATIAELQSSLTQQRDEMKALTTVLTQQAAQIEKVSPQLAAGGTVRLVSGE